MVRRLYCIVIDRNFSQIQPALFEWIQDAEMLFPEKVLILDSVTQLFHREIETDDHGVDYPTDYVQTTIFYHYE